MSNLNEIYFPKQGNLTPEYVSNGEKRKPVRPLGVFSDIVVETMPQILSQDSKENISYLQTAFGESALDIIMSEDQTPIEPVARLDVLMAATALAHNNIEIPTELQRLVRYFSINKLPVLLYEDIIHSNPQNDPRTFLHGEAGADEEHFYLIHKDIEEEMHPLVTNALESITGDKNPEDLKAVANGLNTLVINTRTVGRKMQHFDKFRPYLGPVPVDMTGMNSEERYAGPSGAYSGTVHALDLALMGIESEDDEIKKYVEDNSMYFPKGDQKLVDMGLSIATNKESMLDYVRRSEYDPTLVEGFGEIAYQLLVFRHVHKHAVAKQVPGLIEDPTAMGTGGISAVGSFLDKRIQKIQNALQEINFTKGGNTHGR